MIEFGRTLRTAREAKGYTIAQITELTHLAPLTVEALENEDFSRIPAPIYGRGFVKLYCEAVGLDPKPLVAEFMDIYTGNREPFIRENPVVASEPPSPIASVPQPPVAPEPPTPVAAAPQPAAPQAEPDLFSPPEPPPAPRPITPAPQPVAPEPPPPAEPDFFSEPLPPPMPESPIAPPVEPPPPQPRLSRYAAPISQSEDMRGSMPSFSPAIWRIAALACIAILLLWLGFLGVRALYRATGNTQGGDDQPAVAQTAEEAHKEAKSEKETKPDKEAKPVKESTPVKETKLPAKATKPKAAAKPAPAAKRKPQSIPSLYVD